MRTIKPGSDSGSDILWSHYKLVGGVLVIRTGIGRDLGLIHSDISQVDFEVLNLTDVLALAHQQEPVAKEDVALLGELVLGKQPCHRERLAPQTSV